VTAQFQNVTDEDLARQTQAGSLSAFEELVHRYETRVFGFVFNFCRCEADAREITQDTFVRAFQRIHRFDPAQAFRTWLFTIARRKGIDRFRATREVDAAPLPGEMADAADPCELLARNEERRDLWRIARRSLGATQFRALWLRYAEDMELRDIARVLGKTETHVKVLLFRARNSLGDELRRQRTANLSGSDGRDVALRRPARAERAEQTSMVTGKTAPLVAVRKDRGANGAAHRPYQERCQDAL
jgi:RNA polymerase sigma-70 factor (ECF subfamily)